MVSDKIINLASTFLDKKYDVALSLHPIFRQMLLNVGATPGADIGMAWIYHLSTIALEKIGKPNPLLPTPWALAQLVHCRNIAYKCNKPFYSTNKPVVTIDCETLGPMDKMNAYFRKGDIFLVANDAGQFRCGIIINVKCNDFLSIEPLTDQFVSKRRKYNQIAHIIRLC